MKEFQERFALMFGPMSDVMIRESKVEIRPGQQNRLIIPVRIFIFGAYDDKLRHDYRYTIGCRVAEACHVAFELTDFGKKGCGTQSMSFVFLVDSMEDAISRVSEIATVMAQFQIALKWAGRWIEAEEERFILKERTTIGLQAVGL